MRTKQEIAEYDKQVYQDILNYLDKAIYQVFNLRTITYCFKASCYTVKDDCLPSWVYSAMMRLQKQGLIKNVGHNAWMLTEKK